MNVIKYLKDLLGAEKEAGPVGFRIAAVSHKGKVRGNNEDNFCVMGTVLPLMHEGTEGILEFQVDASSAGNIKPYALLDALLSFAGKDTPPFWAVQFTRLETWTRAGADGKLIPLGDVGEAF